MQYMWAVRDKKTGDLKVACNARSRARSLKRLLGSKNHQVVKIETTVVSTKG